MIDFIPCCRHHDVQAPQQRAEQARPRPRQVHPVQQLLQGVPQGQGRQEVRH